MAVNDDTIKSIAAWDLERSKDYYPADALDKDGCFYNGQIGNCGSKCPCYLLGNCPVEDEIPEEG